MNLNDPRCIAEAARYAAAVKAQAATIRPRYVAGRSTEKRGYTVLDAVPRFSLGDDIEGIGWWWWPQPRRMPAGMGWYKYRKDAEARARGLNEAQEKAA